MGFAVWLELEAWYLARLKGGGILFLDRGAA